MAPGGKTAQGKEATPVDAASLKKLLDAIEAVRIEANDPAATKPVEEQTTFVDPSKFPPTYRDRIQSYFEQLSTHSQMRPRRTGASLCDFRPFANP